MATVSTTPGLSALLAWPTDHLTEAAAHWDSVGERSYGVAHGVWSDALAVDWDGDAADALRTDTHADLMTTSATVDQLQAAAAAARSGASDLEAARSQVRYAVEDARAAGFDVGENLSVTDRISGGSAAQRAARQAAAQAFAADIGGRAAQLVSTDAQVASSVTAAMSGVGNTFPQTPPTNGQIHAVDNHTFKQDPAFPVNPENMTEAEARAAWAEVNSEINAWNARCGRTFILPTEQGAYEACNADKQALLDKQAAIRARLKDLGVPIEGETSPNPGAGTGGPIPRNVKDALDQIDAGKWPGSANAPGTKGGSSFDNVTPSGQHPLPTADASGRPITYQEWDTNPRVAGQDRDAQRIITGSDGSAWYTTDHYQTFHRIR